MGVQLGQYLNPKATREWAPGTSAAAFPTSVTCRACILKARAANTGKVAFGFASSITLPDGTTDAVAGYELSAGEESPLLGVSNLNLIYGIGTGASDSVLILYFA